MLVWLGWLIRWMERGAARKLSTPEPAKDPSTNRTKPKVKNCKSLSVIPFAHLITRHLPSGYLRPPLSFPKKIFSSLTPFRRPNIRSCMSSTSVVDIRVCWTIVSSAGSLKARPTPSFPKECVRLDSSKYQNAQSRYLFSLEASIRARPPLHDGEDISPDGSSR